MPPSAPRRRSIRLKSYDYTRAGAYFVTVCAARGDCLFGRVGDGHSQLNVLGEAVAACWQAIPEHFPHVTLDEFVVMPNHVHGILLLSESEAKASAGGAAEAFGEPVPGSLPTIVRSFKAAVTKAVRGLPGMRNARVWQRGYYEHVVRREDDLMETRRYIRDNPLKWELDEENPHGRDS